MAKKKGGAVQSLYPPKEGAVIILDVDILGQFKIYGFRLFLMPLKCTH